MRKAKENKKSHMSQTTQVFLFPFKVPVFLQHFLKFSRQRKSNHFQISCRTCNKYNCYREREMGKIYFNVIVFKYLVSWNPSATASFSWNKMHGGRELDEPFPLDTLSGKTVCVHFPLSSLKTTSTSFPYQHGSPSQPFGVSYSFVWGFLIQFGEVLFVSLYLILDRFVKSDW